MAAFIDFAKMYLMPGTTWFLVVGVFLGVVLLYGARSAAWGRRWLVALLLLYVTLSVPAVSLWMQRTLAGTVTRETHPATNIDAIVVLGSGVISIGPADAVIHIPSLKTALNITEAVRQYRLLKHPRIVASGGIPPAGVGKRPEAEVIRDYLIGLGVAANDVTVESGSTTTVEQAVRVAAMLPPKSRVLLVAVPLHMPRARALFGARGLDVVPAVAGEIVEGAADTPAPFMPSPYALRGSTDTIHELLGLVYYRLRGDILP